MKYLAGLGLLAGILGGALLTFNSQQAFGVTVCLTSQGCTGTSTPGGIMYGDNGATQTLRSVTVGSGLTFSGGTLSASGAGTVTQVNTTYPITGGPITTTGTVALAFGTTTANTWSAYNNFTYGINAALSSSTQSTSTNKTITGNTILSQMTSALLQTGSDGLVAEYAGTTCTNQFVRVLSALGVATCATVGAADVDLADLTAGNSSLTFSGTYDGQTARNIVLNVANANTWSVLQTFSAASTTYQSIATWLGIPNGTDPTITSSGIGTIAINETAASSSIRYDDGTAERALFDVTPRTFNYPTSTPAGTTTIMLAGSSRAMTYTSIGCSSVGGTANVNYGIGTATSTNVVSATSPTATTLTTLSSNNTQNMGQVAYIAIGSWSSTAISQITCTLDRRFNAD